MSGGVHATIAGIQIVGGAVGYKHARDTLQMHLIGTLTSMDYQVFFSQNT